MPAKKVLPKKSAKSWKDIQVRVKKNKRNKLALIILGLIIGFLVISWTIHFTQSLFGSKKYNWNGEYTINVLVRSPAISLVSYSPKDNKVVIIDIPDETFLEVPNGFGSWQLRSVYDLGQSQKELGGGKLLKNTIRDFFAVPIDGFIDLNNLKPTKSAAEIIEIIRQNPISGSNLLPILKTDLTAWELLKLKWGIGSVRFDKIIKINLLKLNVLEKGNLADGTVVFNFDPVKLDSVLTDLQDPAIVEEHKTIAVFNATDQPQLAQKWSRLITNLGGNVIITSNAQTKLKKTQVTGEQSPTLKRLQQIFVLDCLDNPKCGKISQPEREIVVQRAQINLLLGEDYINK